MTKWLAMLMACVALGLVAGCGDDDEDEGGGSADTTEEPAPKGGGQDDKSAAGGKAVEVSMKDISFNPDSVTVSKGATVTWVNDEDVGHDVTKESGPGPDFSSGDPGGMSKGDEFKQTFDAAGTIEYVCTVHKGTMTGTIVVK